MSVNDYRKQQRPDPWDSAREPTNDLERLIASIPQPVQQHSGNTDSAGRDWLAIARKHGYALPDKRMCGFVADLLAAREPAPVARELDVEAERREFEARMGPQGDDPMPEWWYRLHAAAESLADHGCDANAADVRDIANSWLLARRAAPAPVRTEQAAGAPGWISVEDRLPQDNALVMVYSPPTKYDHPGEVNIGFDCIDPNDDDRASWLGHNEHYEHYCCVAKPEGSTGPSEKAPYTHWMPLPAAPSPNSPVGAKEQDK